MDEPWSDRLLEHDKVHAERGTAKKVEGATRSDKPIATDRIAAWVEDKTPEQLTVLSTKAGALAEFYGYDVADAAALAPMRAPGSTHVKTLTGTELAARKAQFPLLAAEFDREITPWAGNADAHARRVRHGQGSWPPGREEGGGRPGPAGEGRDHQAGPAAGPQASSPGEVADVVTSAGAVPGAPAVAVDDNGVIGPEQDPAAGVDQRWRRRIEEGG